uniref:CHK kinase-like domain-containing protein n=1 Tax=Panagrolaimus davidi TaxID=227884 RepID=A0A914Q516_9BILA
MKICHFKVQFKKLHHSDETEKFNLKIFNLNFADSFQPIVSKYHKLCRSTDFYLYIYQQAHKDLELPSVIVQGDMHPGNLMWSIDKNDNIQNSIAAIVDWQTMQEGSPMTDLARFLVHCADGNIRREAESFAIKLYYQCLIEEFGDISKVPYTLEKLQQAYKYAFLAQALYSLGTMDFFVPSMEEKIKDEKMRKDLFDSGMLKSLHVFEDSDKLLEGELNDLFIKFG